MDKENGNVPPGGEVDIKNLPVKRGAIDIQLGSMSGQKVLAINSYVELLQVAKLYFVSQMQPKSLDSVEKVAVGIAKCMELGVPYVTFLQHIAVINGQASVWGAGVLALIQGSGQLVKWEEEESGTPYEDDWTFTCIVQRKGRKEVKHAWTWADARRAGFDNPMRWEKESHKRVKDEYSPWTRFPKRMMQWKARAWPFKDQFADLMAGLVLVEDAQDIVSLGRDASGAYAMPGESDPNQKGKPEITVTRLQKTMEDKNAAGPDTTFMD